MVKDGQPYQATSRTFSSVTFADDNRFYAAMSTGDLRYLIEGDIAAKRVLTVTEDVEGPSLSPDGTRIAFTHINGGADDIDHDHGGHGESEPIWQLSILDLGTLRITHLGETRSVDDQAVWLDDATVAYSLQRPDGTNDIWAVPADGTGSPRMIVPGANSPAPVVA
jgi:Tol biopolymer transport system component